MGADEYLKTTCEHCGGHLEFPQSASGKAATCPHCKKDIFLLYGEEPPNTESEMLEKVVTETKNFAIRAKGWANRKTASNLLKAVSDAVKVFGVGALGLVLVVFIALALYGGLKNKWENSATWGLIIFVPAVMIGALLLILIISLIARAADKAPETQAKSAPEMMRPQNQSPNQLPTQVPNQHAKIESKGTIFNVPAIILVILGCIGVTYYMFYFNTLVKDPDGGSEYNIGLLNDRQCGVIASVGSFLAGLIIGATNAICALTELLKRAFSNADKR